MGKLNHERHLSFVYPPVVIEGWNMLTPEQKNIFNEHGKPYGYTGMNVLLLSIIQWGALHLGDGDQEIFYYRKKN